MTHIWRIKWRNDCFMRHRQGQAFESNSHTQGLRISVPTRRHTYYSSRHHILYYIPARGHKVFLFPRCFSSLSLNTHFFHGSLTTSLYSTYPHGLHRIYWFMHIVIHNSYYVSFSYSSYVLLLVWPILHLGTCLLWNWYWFGLYHTWIVYDIF